MTTESSKNQNFIRKHPSEGMDALEKESKLPLISFIELLNIFNTFYLSQLAFFIELFILFLRIVI